MSWKDEKWGIDRNDPRSVEAFEHGQRLAETQEAWLSELDAHKVIGREEARFMANITGPPPNWQAMRFGFCAAMEEKFGRTYE